MHVHVVISTATSAPLKPKLIIVNAAYVRDGDRRDISSTSDEQPAEARAIVNGYYLQYSKSPNRTVRDASFAMNGHKFTGPALESTMMFEGALEGWLADPEPNSDVLRHSAAADARVLDPLESVDGAQCVVLTGSSKYGSTTFWCDPKLRYLARKIVIAKSEHDLIGKARVGDLRLRAPGAGLMAPSRITFTADSIKFETVGAVTLPMSCHVAERYDFPGGIWYAREATITREDVDLHPDLSKPGLLVPDLPDGTRLSNQENLQIPYEWRAGKPVPLVNQSAVQQMDATAAAARAARNGIGR